MPDIPAPSGPVATLSIEEKLRMLRELRTRGAAGGEDLSAPRRLGQAEAPLSSAQQALWLVDQLEPVGAAYNMATAVTLRGLLDVEALERALREIVRRHEALRTTFDARGGHPVQVIAPAEAWRIEVEDLRALSAGARSSAVEQRAAEKAMCPLDLQRGPLFRATLIRGDGEHTLLLMMHHIVSDGWSMEVMLRELGALYTAFLRGEPSPLPELPVQYADFAVWQRRHLDGAVQERHLAYWREALKDAPPLLELPTDRPRPATPGYQGRILYFTLDGGLAERLRALASGLGSTPFMLLLAAWQVLLSRYSGQTDVVVGSPSAGRAREALEGMIGYFVNMLPLRADLSGDPTFRTFLAEVRESTLRAFQHEELPFARVVDGLRVGRSTRWHPLFQVAFSYHTTRFAPTLGESDIRMQVRDLPTQTSKFDLNLHLTEGEGQLLGELEYSTELWDGDTVARMVGHFTVLLEEITADPDRPVSRLPIVSGEERAALLEASSRGGNRFPVEHCVHDRVAAQARRRPDAVAVTYEEESLTYGELDARANQLAHHLRVQGVGPGTRIGLCLERSAELVVAILGVLKAGAAYVPLDPGYPADRISFILEDAAPTHLVTRGEALDAQLGIARAAEAAGIVVVRLDGTAAALASHPRTPPESGVRPGDPAYVIFTSGSTGKPKGVVVTHANAARLFLATEQWFGFGERDVWTLFHSYAFDFSVWEIWGALLYGGRLVVVPFLATRSPDAFRALVAREGVTVLNQTPSAFRQFVQADADAADAPALALRYVIFGGEALDPASVRRWFARHGEEAPRLVNMYGITETTVHVTICPLSPALLDATSPGVTPIGVPIPDLRVYVLDAARQPVPAGLTGEMYVGGAGVAAGYLKRPGLTAERFLPDPFTGGGGTLYRTGDLSRLRADGTLEYVGRIDGQVKLRGFRIELGEIEAALAAQPEVREAVVLLRDHPAGDKQLVAYVVLHPGGAEDPLRLRTALAGRLPDYMIPAAFVLVPELPLTSQGKLDHRALPGPEAARMLRPAYVPPASPRERLLQAVWQEVLRVEDVGVTEDFFAAGGDSLRAVQVVSALRARGVPLGLRDLFQFPTIRALAEREGDGGDGTGGIPLHLARVDEEEAARMRARFGDALEEVLLAARMQALMVAEYERDTARVGIYHPQQGYRLTDPGLSIPALRHAIEQLVRRHPMLRTTFAAASDGALLQVVRGGIPLPVAYEDCRSAGAEEQDRSVRKWIDEDLDTPFVTGDPSVLLMRFAIFQRADNTADLLMSAHHAIEDGWGNVHFLNTLFQTYAAARDGHPVPGAPVLSTYREFVALEAETLASTEARAFWNARAREARPAWPAPIPQPAEAPRACHRSRSVPEALTGALRAAASGRRVALKAVYLAPFLDLVRTLAEEGDACAGVVWNGRSERLSNPFEELGLFWNLLPVWRPSGETVEERILAVHDDLLRADPYSRYPLSEIVAANAGREPFFATFNFLHFHHWDVPQAGRGLRVDPVHDYDRFHLPFNLLVSLEPEGEGANLRVEYDPGFFTAAAVNAALDDYLLRLAAVACPGPAGDARG